LESARATDFQDVKARLKQIGLYQKQRVDNYFTSKGEAIDIFQAM